MAYKLKTAPAEEPITTTEAKTHLRVDGSTDDTYIGTLIKTARRYAEAFLNQKLITQTWYCYLDKFPASGEIMIKNGPVQSLTAITYQDENDAEQTLSTDDYVVDTATDPARVEITTIPATYDKLNAIRIEYVAGYGAAADVPETIKHAMLLYMGSLYENRGDEGHRTIPAAVNQLLSQSRIMIF